MRTIIQGTLFSLVFLISFSAYAGDAPEFKREAVGPSAIERKCGSSSPEAQKSVEKMIEEYENCIAKEEKLALITHEQDCNRHSKTFEEYKACADSGLSVVHQPDTIKTIATLTDDDAKKLVQAIIEMIQKNPLAEPIEEKESFEGSGYCRGFVNREPHCQIAVHRLGRISGHARIAYNNALKYIPEDQDPYTAEFNIKLTHDGSKDSGEITTSSPNTQKVLRTN